MLKSELISDLAVALHTDEKSAANLLSKVADSIISGCADDGMVVIRGLGTFKVNIRSARIGTHPRTGERRSYRATRMVSFRPSKRMRDVI